MCPFETLPCFVAESDRCDEDVLDADGVVPLDEVRRREGLAYLDHGGAVEQREIS